MSLQFSTKQALKQNVEERMRTLCGLIKDIERYRRKALPPIGTKIEGAQSVIRTQIKGSQINYAKGPPLERREKECHQHEIIQKNCDRYYKSLRQIIKENRWEQQKKTREQQMRRSEARKEERHQHEKQIREEEYPKIDHKKQKDMKTPSHRKHSGRPITTKVRDVLATHSGPCIHLRDSNETLKPSRENCITQIPQAGGNSLKEFTAKYKLDNQTTTHQRKHRRRHSLAKHNSDQQSMLWRPDYAESNRNYLLREIKSAIIEGHSQDPVTNAKLSHVIRKALNQNIPWPMLEKTISEVSQPQKREKMVHLLQIQVGGRIYVMATVRTSNFPSVLAQIDPCMHQCNAEFVPVLQHFVHCCCIEAIVPQMGKYLDPLKLKKRLQTDTLLFKVQVIDIIDADTGEVCVKCELQSMMWTHKAMQDRGYTILATDYGFKPLKYVSLGSKSASNYRRFLNHLVKIKDIETICDNVL